MPLGWLLIRPSILSPTRAAIVLLVLFTFLDRGEEIQRSLGFVVLDVRDQGLILRAESVEKRFRGLLVQLSLPVEVSVVLVETSTETGQLREVLHHGLVVPLRYTR